MYPHYRCTWGTRIKSCFDPNRKESKSAIFVLMSTLPLVTDRLSRGKLWGNVRFAWCMLLSVCWLLLLREERTWPGLGWLPRLDRYPGFCNFWATILAQLFIVLSLQQPRTFTALRARAQRKKIKLTKKVRFSMLVYSGNPA
jgi:hypothetical protein